MSVAVISYRSLNDAASEAKTVARKLDNYAENLNRCVYQKLNQYSGSYSSNIHTARRKTNEKIVDLRKKSSAYSNYANDLSELKSQCSNTDRTVKTMVSKLTSHFKKANGIKNSKVENIINYFLASLKNSSNAGRWLSHTSDQMKSVKEYIKQSVKHWWNYEGGKEFIEGVLIGVIEIASIVLEITAGSLTVFGAVVAAIAIINGVVNIVNEFRAYDETHNNADPAMGRRRSNENSIQDTLRTESDSSFLHNIATGLDVIDIINDLKGKGEFLKKGYNWISKGKSLLKNFKVKDIFKSSSASVKTDFMNNLKNHFLDFSKLDKGLSSTKNILNSMKNFVNDGFSVKNTVKDFVLPGINITEITRIKEGKDGQMQFELKKIFASDAYEFMKKGVENISSLPEFGGKVLNVFNKKSDIHIAIPNLKNIQTNVNLPVRAAF